MAKSSGKILIDPEIGEVLFRTRLRSRSISIRVHPVKGISVSVPYMVPYAAAEAFFLLKRSRIMEIVSRQKEKYTDMPQATTLICGHKFVIQTASNSSQKRAYSIRLQQSHSRKTSLKWVAAKTR